MTDLPETYTDENGKVRVYTLAKYLDDSDPSWRTRLGDEMVEYILSGGFFSEDEAREYLWGRNAEDNHD